MADEAHAPKSATPITCAHNRSVLGALPFGDRADFEDARRGFIGSCRRWNSAMPTDG